MNVIITGGNGFVGTKLAEKFNSHGHKIFLLDYKKKSQNKIFLKKGKFKKVDITSFKSLEKVQVPNNAILLHCAGQPSAAVSFKRPIDDHKKNILGMLNIIKFAKKKKLSLLQLLIFIKKTLDLQNLKKILSVSQNPYMQFQN